MPTLCNGPAFDDQPLPLSPGRKARGRRVICLLTALLLLGLGDLYATYTHASSVGMHEVNPVGAYLIAERSWAGLTLFKLGTLGVTVGLLLKVRQHAKAEFAAWFLCAVMTLLTFHWHSYNETMSAEMVGPLFPQPPGVQAASRLAAATSTTTTATTAVE